MSRAFIAICIGAACACAAPVAASAQETANAIIACQLRQVDANYANPRNRNELRLLDERKEIAIGFTVDESTVDMSAIRLFDPGRVFGGNRLAEVNWNSQTRGFVIRTEAGGEGAVSLVISGPESGRQTLGAVLVRTSEAATRNPLAYMFNGRCGLLPTRNLAADFEAYIATVSERP